MTAPLDARERELLLRSVVLGTRHAAPAVPERLGRGRDAGEAVLTALAFAAHQDQLCARADRRPASFQSVTAAVDLRPILPEALRPAVARFLRNTRRGEEHLVGAIARTLARTGHRLHPFDTDPSNVALAPCFGPYESWLAGVTKRKAAVADGDDFDAIPATARAEWLRRRRSVDPDGARAKLEASWASQSTDHKPRLLAALEVGLSEADRAFVEAQKKTRSTNLKRVANHLIERLDRGASAVDTDALTAVLHVVDGAIVVAPRQKTNLHKAEAALLACDPAVALAALGTDVDGLRRAEPGVRPLFAAFGTSALRSGNADVFRAVREALDADATQSEAGNAAWHAAVSLWIAAGSELAGERRAAGVALLTEGSLPVMMGTHCDLAEEWSEAFDEPLPAAASRRLRGSLGWSARMGRLADPDVAEAMARELLLLAPLVAPEDADAAATELAAKGALTAARVQQFWRLLAALHAQLPPTQESP